MTVQHLESITSFLDHILQPIAQAQISYLKDTTQFINFIEKRKVPKNAILASMDGCQQCLLTRVLYLAIISRFTKGVPCVCETVGAGESTLTVVPGDRGLHSLSPA